VNSARTAVFCLVLAGVSLAGPSFRIGTKLTWHEGTSAVTWGRSDDTLFKVVFFQPSVGPTVEATYGPAWGVLTGRLDLAQASIFTEGGVALRLFPMLGLDVLLEPPTSWRVKPYLWAGVRTTGYYWMPSRNYDVYQHDCETHWRGGLGGSYRLNERIDLFAEMQWYARDDWWEGFVIFEDGSALPGGLTTESVALSRVEVGVRFALGK